MTSRAVAVALLATLSTVSADALADDEATPPAPVVAPPARERERARERSWYGWQIFPADMAVIATAIALPLAQENAIFALTGFAYLGTGPLVHGLHGHGGKAAGSLGIRAGILLLGLGIGAGIGAALGGSNAAFGDDFAAITGGVIGMLGSTFVATTLDVALLAFDEGPSTAKTKPTTSTASWRPTLLPRPEGGLTLGVSGAL